MSDPQSPSSSGLLLDVLHISKTFTEGDVVRQVLMNVSLEIHQASFVVLVGQSGSGKSTLLNLISGIDEPDRGAIWLDGVELTELSDTERTRFRRSNIGIVFQSFNLIPTLTVRENVLLPLELAGTPSTSQIDAAISRLEEVGLGDRAATFPDRLSGGEQQRVAIARALAHDPRLVLADEPTGNLDADTGRQVLDIFQKLVRETGTALLIATHDPFLVDQADRVIELRRGELLENVTGDDVLQS